MRRLVFSVLLLLIGSTQCWARVSVSPVIVEAMQVKKGDYFKISCQQWGDEALDVHLSLALFDQDQEGSVFFLEDAESSQKAQEILVLEQDRISLEPHGQHVVEVKVLRENFKSAYVVLFVKPDHPGIPTRFAVLFLLSTTGLQEEMTLSSWYQKDQALELTVLNRGSRHGLWQGELLCFDSGGKLGDKLEIKSGVVLAGRSRGFEVSLPSWVKRVEILPTLQGMER